MPRMLAARLLAVAILLAAALLTRQAAGPASEAHGSDASSAGSAIAPAPLVARDLALDAAAPDGCRLIAREECGRPESQPHKVRGSDRELKGDAERPAGSPFATCNVADNWDRAVVYQFDGLDPAARYSIRVGMPPQRGFPNVLANRSYVYLMKASRAPHETPGLSESIDPKVPHLLEFELPKEIASTGKLEIRVATPRGWPAFVSLIELWADRAVTLAPPLASPPTPEHRVLAKTAWNPVPVDGRRFFFRCYDDIAKHRPGGRYARFAEEAKIQGLLDPSWEWPNFSLADSANRVGIYEWDYHHPVDGETKFDCYESRRQFFLQNLLPAKAAGKPFDSFTGHGWLEPYAAEWGADLLVTELGAGSPCVQARIALLRGAGRQWGIPFATQTSTWYGGMLTMYEDGEGEDRPHPGHSSWFQARTWYLSWLAGCLYACPEPAPLNFFHRPPEFRGKPFHAGDAISNAAAADRRFKLSPTGERAKEFLAVTHRVPDVGIPYAPIGLIVDHYAGPHVEPNGRRFEPWWRLEPTPGDMEIARFLDEVYPKTIIFQQGPKPDPYNELRMMANSPYGESFDLLLSTVKPELLKLYPVAVLLGDHQLDTTFRQCLLDYVRGGGHLVVNQRLAGQLGADLDGLRQAGRIWVEEFSRTPAATRDLLDRLTRLYVPIEVKGDVEYTLNRTATGWIVGLIENKGRWKEPKGPVLTNAAISPTITIHPRAGRITAARERVEEKDVAVADNRVAVRVPPGDVRIVELTVEDR